jgi:flagellar biosynthesis GTPase FlhF
MPSVSRDRIVPAEIRRGDATVHHERTIHGSGGNTTSGWRRAYIVAFRAKATVEEERRREAEQRAETARLEEARKEQVRRQAEEARRSEEEARQREQEAHQLEQQITKILKKARKVPEHEAALTAERAEVWQLLDERRLDPNRPAVQGYQRQTDLRVSPTDPDAVTALIVSSLLSRPLLGPSDLDPRHSSAMKG